MKLNTFQQTIKRPSTLSGVGLHTGEIATLNFIPAAANHGIKFKRVDLEGQPIIPADCDLVTSVERGTTLEKNGIKIATVEHLMAALWSLQIDNLLIEIDKSEVPILDGSAILFVNHFESNIQEQIEHKEVFELRIPLSYSDPVNGVEILALPSDHYRVTTMIDYKSDILGQQHATLNRLSDFKSEIASARTFCFLHELEMLINAGLIKGGDLNNAIVVVEKEISPELHIKLQNLFNRPDITVVKEGILNNLKLNHQNEPARHKLLDVVGDLALCGTFFNANIIATRPGHKSNIAFAKKLKAIIKAERLREPAPAYDPNISPVYDTEQIKSMLPHRYPFLLIDKIISVEEKEVVGVKAVTYNESFFQGHFPGNPVMPGVLIIEAMAQTGGMLVLSTLEDPENYDTYFLKIDKAKFKQKVIPGDTLIFKLELTGPIRRGLVEMKGTTFVGNRIVAEADLMAQIVKRK
jgi:UDP-3-O-[3-hydroxymyristoyl] N-acetylglucosamine deacetylase/3-hydroxyacyl-[acyl-carrier-protein] dehydratase